MDKLDLDLGTVFNFIRTLDMEGLELLKAIIQKEIELKNLKKFQEDIKKQEEISLGKI